MPERNPHDLVAAQRAPTVAAPRAERAVSTRGRHRRTKAERAKLRRAIKALWRDPAFRDAMQTAMRRKWQSGEYRKRQRAALPHLRLCCGALRKGHPVECCS